MKVVVIQRAAREHFLAARALHQQGLLAGLVTDWYAFGKQKADILKTEKLPSEVADQRLHGPRKAECGKQKLFQRLSISVLQRFCGASARAARCEAIPDALVCSFPIRSLFWKWRVRRLSAQGRLYEAYVQTDSAFASAVARLKLPPHEIFFGYSYASLEALQAEKARRKMTVLCQIDPGPVHFRLVAEEMLRHPELAGLPPKFPEAYYERNRREWELADVIVVNSEWSREALISEGVNPAKIEILPLAFEAEDRGQKSEVRPPTSDLRPLNVLWLGQVNAPKGIHYLMEAARLLEREKIYFDVVGSVGILPGAVTSAPQNMTFHGSVSRDCVAEWYQQSDVFVLPTLSDGFALTQLEAMAHGLPVITTPNCGRVVEEGKTGFIVPARDPQALAEAIMRFVRNRNLSSEMSPKCREAAAVFSVDAYGQRLVEIIQKHSLASLR